MLKSDIDLILTVFPLYIQITFSLEEIKDKYGIDCEVKIEHKKLKKEDYINVFLMMVNTY